MPKVILDGKRIVDWTSFHSLSKEAFGFPDFYGANMNAWIDCLSYLREDCRMIRFLLAPDEILEIEVSETNEFSQRAPDVMLGFIECAAVVNKRHIEHGEP